MITHVTHVWWGTASYSHHCQTWNRLDGEQWIGHGGPGDWPTRSPYLNPLDFLLWGMKIFGVFSGDQWFESTTATSGEIDSCIIILIKFDYHMPIILYCNHYGSIGQYRFGSLKFCIICRCYALSSKNLQDYMRWWWWRGGIYRINDASPDFPGGRKWYHEKQPCSSSENSITRNGSYLCSQPDRVHFLIAIVLIDFKFCFVVIMPCFEGHHNLSSDMK